jgi:hypothetical protein
VKPCQNSKNQNKKDFFWSKYSHFLKKKSPNSEEKKFGEKIATLD